MLGDSLVHLSLILENDVFTLILENLIFGKRSFVVSCPVLSRFLEMSFLRNDVLLCPVPSCLVLESPF